MKKQVFEMDLQLFADEEIKFQTEDNAQAADQPEDEKQQEAKTYTEKDIEDLKLDLKRQYDEQIENAKKEGMTEAERLSKLSESEKEKEKQSKIEQELSQLRAEKQNMLLKAEAGKLLEKEQMPHDFADIVMAEKAEDIQKNIQILKTAFDKAVEDKVKERLSGKTPEVGSSDKKVNTVENDFEKALGI